MKVKIFNILLLLLLTTFYMSNAQITVEEQNCTSNTNNRSIEGKYNGEINPRNNIFILAGSKNGNRSSWMKMIDAYNLENEKYIDIDDKIEKVEDLKILKNGNIGIIGSRINLGEENTEVLFIQYNSEGEVLLKSQLTSVQNYNHSFQIYEHKELLICVHIDHDESSFSIIHSNLDDGRIIFNSKSKTFNNNFELINIHFHEEQGHFYVIEAETKGNSILGFFSSPNAIYGLDLKGEINWQINNEFKGNGYGSLLDDEGNLVMIGKHQVNESEGDYLFYTFSAQGGKILYKKSLTLKGEQGNITNFIKRPNNNGYVLFANDIEKYDDRLPAHYELVLNEKFELEKQIFITDRSMLTHSNQYLIDDIKSKQTYLNLDYSFDGNCLNITRFNNSNGGEARPTKIWSLLVGIANYKEPVFELETPDIHTMKLANYLESIHYADNPIIPLVNEKANKKDILNELESVFHHPDVTENDMIVFFFSGHGVILENNEGGDIAVLCMYDFDPDNENTYISHDEVLEIMNISRAKHRIIFMEACQDYGMGPPDAIRKLMHNKEKFNLKRAEVKRGTIVITSAKSGEKSREYGETGALFSHYLLKGVTEGKADGYHGNEKDKIITIDELFHYIKDNVDLYSKEKQKLRKWQTTTIEPNDYMDIPLFYLK